MERMLSSELRSHVGARVRLSGWLHHHRRLSRIGFLILRDRTGLAQIVAEEPAALEVVEGLLPETVLDVEGVVVASTQAPGGAEVHQPSFVVLAEPEGMPPVDLRRPRLKEQLPTVLDHAPVALRHPRQRAIFEITAAATHGFRSTLDGLGFTEIQTPKIVASATETGANLFSVDYFGRDAFLAQSPQLYKQTMVGVFERVYEVGPVFRAEPHDTARHLAEYVSLDAELGFVDDHFDVMRAARAAITGMLDAVRERASDAVSLLGVELPRVAEELPWIHFSETGVEELDLAPADERRLCEEHGAELLFVTGFPRAKRPFYTHPEPERPEYTNSFDLLFRGLEVVTGGQRLHRYADYVDALNGRLDGYETYLEAFRHGMPPHGGFAIGLERFVARLIGARNVREATLFPRDLNRLTP